MTTFAKTKTLQSTDDGTQVWQWTGLTALNDDGDPLALPQWSDRTFQVSGTFAAGTVAIQGSNDNVNWHTIGNRQGNLMNFTAPGVNTSQDRVWYVKPVVTVGTGGAMTITVCVHRSDLNGNGA